MTSILITIALLVLSPSSIARSDISCGYAYTEPYVPGVPDDYEKWVKQRAYVSEDERKRELAKAARKMSKAWQSLVRGGKLSRDTEDKILASYLLKNRMTKFNAKIGQGKVALEQAKINRSPTAVNYSTIYADFFLPKLTPGANPTMEEMNEQEKDLQVYLNRINQLKATKKDP